MQRSFPLLLLLFSLLPSIPALPRPPNIVFVLADDLGYNDIGYHNPDILSPVLNDLSTQGVRLENYYVQPVCTPTRSQLLSGRYQIHTGLQHKIISPGQPSGLPLDSPTLPDKLREAGYATHIIGKWHLGFFKEDYLPTRRGFDSFFGPYTGSCDHFTFQKCMGRFCGVDLHNDTGDAFNPVVPDTSRPARAYSTHLFTRRAVDVIHSHNEEKPLFLYLPYTAVHGPVQVPERYIKMNRHIPRGKKLGLVRRHFAGMVSALDEGVGKVVEALKDKGMWENTVFVFSSDNGGRVKKGGSNFPLRGGKGQLFEGGIKAVGFVSGPLVKRQNRTSKALLHVSDWFPTLVRLAGGDLQGTRQLAGYDQWASISEGFPSRRAVVLHNIDQLSKARGPPRVRHAFDTRVRAAVRVGDYKLLTGLKGRKQVQLYNVKDSPDERRDLAPFSRWKVRRMLDILHAFQATAVPPLYPPSDKTHGPLRTGKWEPWM